MSSSTLLMVALVFPALTMTIGCLMARRVGLWPFTTLSVLVCWGLLYFAVLSGVYEHRMTGPTDEGWASFDLETAGMVKVAVLTLGWIPALLYCVAWQAILWFVFLQRKAAPDNFVQ